MCTSRETLIPKIISLLRTEKPKSVLDVGVGNGAYGLLIRQYFDLERLDGVEIWEKNIKKWHEHIYDNIYIGDFNKLELPDYQIYLFVDVIEHMSKEDGLKALKCGGIKIVSIPIGHLPQPPVDNPWEAHISEWDWSDLKGFNVVNKVKDDKHIICTIK